jgi:hypothetical protein
VDEIFRHYILCECIFSTTNYIGGQDWFFVFTIHIKKIARYNLIAENHVHGDHFKNKIVCTGLNFFMIVIGRNFLQTKCFLSYWRIFIAQIFRNNCFRDWIFIPAVRYLTYKFKIAIYPFRSLLISKYQYLSRQCISEAPRLFHGIEESVLLYRYQLLSEIRIQRLQINQSML